MTLRVKNVEYFEWEVPEEIVDKYAENRTKQELIDDYFDIDSLGVIQTSETLYELEEIINE